MLSRMRPEKGCTPVHKEGFELAPEKLFDGGLKKAVAPLCIERWRTSAPHTTLREVIVMENRKHALTRQDLSEEQYQAVSRLFTVIRDLKARLAMQDAA